MPNGTSAPGEVFPPPLVQVRVSTSAAGSLTGWLTTAEFRAPAGSFALASGFAQSVTRPSSASSQAVRWCAGRVAADGADGGRAEMGLLGPGRGLALGVGRGLVLAMAAVLPSDRPTASIAAAARVTAAGQRAGRTVYLGLIDRPPRCGPVPLRNPPGVTTSSPLQN